MTSFERLNGLRDAGPFSVAPIGIMTEVGLAAERARDISLVDVDVMLEKGTAFSRVVATPNTSRMRQLLSIMGWVPLDPGSDEHWILDEPVVLPAGSNARVADRTAHEYAAALSHLFPRQEGVFAGYAFPGEGAASSSLKERRAIVRRIAERIWVALSIQGRIAPSTVLHYWLGRNVDRIASARARCGMDELDCPSLTTVQRWCREFGETHAGRPGLGRDWKNHFEPTAEQLAVFRSGRG